MAIKVLPTSNTFTGTNADKFANSTPATETFTMGGGTNTINFDISNNNLLGADEIYLTEGENLVINFTDNRTYSYFNTSLIRWERVQNNDGTIDIAIHTYPYYTLGYGKTVIVVSDTPAYESSYYGTYYEATRYYYLYDYNHDANSDGWVLQPTKTESTTATSDRTYYGLYYVDNTGTMSYQYSDDYYTDRHEERADRNGEVTNQIDGNHILNTITIKNVGANVANSIKLQYTNTYNNVYRLTEYVGNSYVDVDFATKTYDVGSKSPVATEAQTLQGSFLDEKFYAGYGDDTINTVGGTNTVILYNGGNDVITLGEGADTVNANFGNGAYEADLRTNTATEGVYIKGATSADTLLLYDMGTNNFYRDGNNLVIIQNWQYNSDGTRTSKFTVEDYFATESRINIKSGYIYQSGDSIYNHENIYALTGENTITSTYMYNNTETEHTIKDIIQSSSATVNGTDGDDTIIASAQATITTGDGNDTIYTSSASDVITVNGSGDKHIILDVNTGDDTIDIQNFDGRIYLDMPNSLGFTLIKNKSADDNNLIVERYMNAWDSAQQSYIRKYVGRTAVKDYFTFTAEQKAKIYYRTLNGGTVLKVNRLYIEGDEGEANTISGTEFNDVITGKELVDTIFTGKGRDDITPGEGDDIININNTGEKTINIVKGDGNDTINLSGDALKSDPVTYDGNSLKIYSDAYTGGSYQISGDDLILYRTYVDGDDILTESTTIKGIASTTEAPAVITAENIANSGGGLNISGKLYTRNGENSDYFTVNTPWLIEGNKNTANNITATHETTNYNSNLIIGGSKNDVITAEGVINHVYTGAGNDTINVTSTQSSVIYGGSGDDTININGGYATVYMGIGNDVVNINGGTGGEIRFEQGGGDKTVNFNGLTDNPYVFALEYKPNYRINKYTKDNKNLILEAIYTQGGEDYIEHYTLNNFFDPNLATVNNDGTKFYYSSTYYRPSWINLNVDGIYDEEQNATIFEGTMFEDSIEGTDGVDIITTGTSDDKITGGKGNDQITINGNGGKYFYYAQGDGDDTIIIGENVTFESGYIDLCPTDYNAQPQRHSFKMDGNDLILYRTYNNDGDAVTDSTRMTGIKSKTSTPVEVTPENIANYEGGLNVSDEIYISGYGMFKANMPQMLQGNLNSPNNNLETLIETKNTVIGGLYADTINLQGNDDYAYAGAGDDNITTSATSATIYAGAGDDTIIATSGNANIYSGNGNDTIKIRGGQGTINMELGKGNDTIIFESNNTDGTCDLEGVYNINIVSPGSGYGYGMSYSKSGDDLLIRVGHDEGTDVHKIKGLFGANQLSDGNKLQINGYNLSAMTIKGNYDAKLKATVYEGSNYNDFIDGTSGVDIIYTGAGDDEIHPNEGNDTIKVTGNGRKIIYNYKGYGNDTVQLATSNIGELRFYNYGSPNANSYQIKNNNLVLYRTYVNGDKFTNEATTITGITSVGETPADVTYENITNSEGGLNISGKITSGMPDLLLIQGNAKKANRFATIAGANNLYLGGAKNDTVTINGSENHHIYTGAGTDTINANSTGYAYIYTGSGNDIINVNSSGNYTLYSTKGGGNDTVKIGKDFSGSLRVYANDDVTNTSYQIDKNKNLIIYKTYVNGDTIKTDSTKITGIKPLSAENPVDVTYATITGSGLNISGRFFGMNNYWMTQGNAKKANKLTSKKDMNNVVTGGSKNDTVNLQGYNDYAYTSAGNDTVNVTTTGTSYVYTGSGTDTINIKNNSNTYVYTGKGNDKINITGGTNSRIYHYVTAGEGNDTVKFTNTDFNRYDMSFNNYNSYSGTYYKSGNDLLVKNTYKNSSSKTLTETHTIKDYFKDMTTLENKVYINGSSASYRLSSNELNIVGAANKKKKETTFTGTKFNDIINGTSGKDIITTGNGNDTITPGAGADTITIDGSGYKTIKIGNDTGNDVIQWADSETATGTAKLVYNPNDAFSSKRSGTDLIITRTYTPGGKTVKSETTTVKGYYNSDGTVNETVADKLYVNGIKYDPATSVNRVNYKATTATINNDREFAVTTAKNDTITVNSDNTVIFALSGNDNITLNGNNSFIVGGYGNDTIHLNTEGQATVCHLSGDGNDTVVFDKAPSSLTLSIETHTRISNFEYMMIAGKFGFRKSGDNLQCLLPVNNTKTTKSEVITLTGYYNEDTPKPESINMYLMTPDYAHSFSLSSLIAEAGVWVTATTSGGTSTFTGSDDISRNNYEYKGTGKALINGSSNTDFTIATIGKKSNLTINDKGGTDYLYINSAYTNLKAFMNVDAFGSVIVSSGNEYSDNLMIFNKGSLTASNMKNIISGKNGTGAINIDHFFKGNGGEAYATGDGNIERIYAAKDLNTQIYNYDSGGAEKIQNIIAEGWIHQVCEQVSNWLSTYSNGKYADSTALDVIQTGSTADINAMLKVYNGITYNKTYAT